MKPPVYAMMPPRVDAPVGKMKPVQQPKVAPMRGIDEALDYYLGPTGIPDKLRAVNSMFNPVETLGGSMKASQRMLAPDTAPMDRVRYMGDMLSGIGGFVAPMVAAAKVGAPAASAVADAFTGISTAPATQAAKTTATDFAMGESGAMRDPRMWHPMSNIKLRRPIDEMSASVTSTGTLLPSRPVNIEGLQGKTLIPAFGDRTAAGGVLDALNGNPLSSPVRLEGGADFMREHDTGLWASEKKPMSSKARLIRDTAAAGEDPILAYTAMGGTAGDFSTMMGDALMGQLDPSKISASAAKEYDTAIREGYGAVKPIDPAWPGIRSPEAADRLRSIPGSNRRLAILEMEKEARQAAGFPDVAAARYGITDSRLLNAKPFDTGITFGAPERSGRIMGADSNLRTHNSYDTQIGGEYIGGAEKSLPGEMIWRDFFGERRASGAPQKSDQRAFLMRTDTKQKVDQKMIDEIMAYLGR